METMGQRFKAAREKKRVSLSQAALKTHTKVQHLEAMERDDFSRMPAPIYARGFIKTYCDFLGLDPAPMIQEYNEQYGGAKRPSIPVDAKIIKNVPGEQPLPSGPAPEAGATDETGQAGGGPLPAASEWPVDLRTLAIGGAVIGVMLLIVAAVKFWPASKDEGRELGSGVVEVDRPVARSPLAVMREPPEPYVEVSNGGDREP